MTETYFQKVAFTSISIRARLQNFFFNYESSHNISRIKTILAEDCLKITRRRMINGDKALIELSRSDLTSSVHVLLFFEIDCRLHSCFKVLLLITF